VVAITGLGTVYNQHEFNAEKQGRWWCGRPSCGGSSG